MIDLVDSTYPEATIILCGMQVPPNMGEQYASSFQKIYGEIASEKKDITLIPFLLEGVAGIQKLNQADGIHPTKEGCELVANTVWTYLEPALKK